MLVYIFKNDNLQPEYFPWKQNPVNYTSNRITNFVYGASGELLYEEITETVYENSIADTLTKRKEYIYDVNGVCGCIYTRDNGVATEYYYGKNVHGDILEVYDVNGNMVCEYTYDAFGSSYVTDHLNDGFATENPFRYRGYYYDETLDLYYLSTRFYDPETGRFISPDTVDYIDPESVNGLNLYVYCNNDPVNFVDPSGNLAISLLIASAFVGFGVSFGISVVSQAIFDSDINWGVALVDGAFGAVTGALSIIPNIGAIAYGFLNAGLTALNSTITIGIENDWSYSSIDIGMIAMSTLLSGVTSGVLKKQAIKAQYDKKSIAAHSQAKNIAKRLNNGKYYKNGAKLGAISARSAKRHVHKLAMSLNFGQGFLRDWSINLLSAIFITNFNIGMRGFLI